MLTPFLSLYGNKLKTNNKQITNNMKTYIIVNLIGAMNDKITLFIETNEYNKIKDIVKNNGYGDYKILNDWKIIKSGKVINK